MNNQIEEQISQLMDSFLVEAPNQYGEYRSLSQLNLDRQLFVENMMKLIDRIRKEKDAEFVTLLKDLEPHEEHPTSFPTDNPDYVKGYLDAVKINNNVVDVIIA